jgi:hypothetical protein
MVDLVRFLQGKGIETVECCCDHDICPKTIIVRTGKPWVTREICHNITTFRGRKKRFYRKDENGVY